MNSQRIKGFFDLTLDFLFPASESIKKIEQTSAAELMRTLPRSEPSHTDVCTLFAYRDEKVKHLVWEIKYYKNEKIMDAVGFLIAQKIQERLANIPNHFYVVPIPLTLKRLRERGFNHTELLSKSILKYLPSNFELATAILKKVRHTPKQSSIEDRQERFNNIRGAFEVSRPENSQTETQFLQNKNIILIDDVFTTGATMLEAKRVLLAGGAVNVLTFAIAH